LKFSKEDILDTLVSADLEDSIKTSIANAQKAGLKDSGFTDEELKGISNKDLTAVHNANLELDKVLGD
jgi:hypothetical protein